MVQEIIKLSKNLEQGQTIEWEFKNGSYTNMQDRNRGDFYFYATNQTIYWAKQLSKYECDYDYTEKYVDDMTDADWNYLANILNRKSRKFFGGNLFAYDMNTRQELITI